MGRGGNVYEYTFIEKMLWPGWAGSGVGSRQWVVVMSGQAGSPYGCRSNAPCSLNKQKMVIKYIHMYVNIYMYIFI